MFYYKVGSNFFGTDHLEYCRLMDNVGAGLIWEIEDLNVLSIKKYPELYL
jgi:hypothetical protein